MGTPEKNGKDTKEAAIDVGALIAVAAMAGFAVSEAVHNGDDPVPAVTDALDATGWPVALRHQIAMHVGRSLQAIVGARQRARADVTKRVSPTIQ